MTAVALAAFLLISGFLLARPGNEDFFTSAGDIAQGATTGAIVAFVILLVVGSIRFGVSRARKREDAAWSRSTFALGTMAVALLVVFLSAAGRFAQEQEDLDAAIADSGGSRIEQQKAREELTAWYEFTRGPIQEDMVAAARAHLDFLDLFEKRGNTPRVENRAKAVRGLFIDLRSRIEREMPDLGGGELEPLAEDFERVFGLYVSAYRDYVRALEQERDALLRSGDRKFQDASSLLRSLTERELEIAERVDAAS